MTDREKIIKAIEKAKKQSEQYALDRIVVPFKEADMILALLKEQEARVLNWDEVENYSVVYGEFRGEEEIFPLIITKDASGRILSWNPGINRSGEYILLVSDEEDRQNTRCWNIEPTDEQREAVKWE